MADVTKEIGHGNISQFPRSEFFNDAEVVPELQPPNDIAIFNKMRNDAQIAGLLLAVTMPIRRWSWSIDPNGARDEVTQFVADNLNLPVLGGDADQPKKRSKGRFSHDRHLYQALLSLVYGHSYFEQVYRYENADSSGRVPRGVDPGRLLLRKLSPRMPLTIQKIEVAVDGGLEYIQQWPSGRPDAAYTSVVPLYSLGGPIIEVDRLVAYVHDQEGGNFRGRALPLDTPIPGPDGWTTMGEIKEGDRLFDENGQIRHVVAKSEVWENRPCYRVKFGDGASLIADENHLWESYTYMARHHGHEPAVVTTKEMAETLRYGKTMTRKPSNHSVVKAKPLQYQRQAQLLDPYVLGAWLGDGDSLNGAITSSVWDLDDMIFQIEGAGFPTKSVVAGVKDGNGRRIRIYGGLATKLRALGVLGDKHIPDGYLRGDIQQRMALLQGLMDTDGSTTNGRCEFSNTNKNLVDGVVELVHSLGCTVHVHQITRDRSKDVLPRTGLPAQKPLKTAWRVSFTPTFTPFRISRKVEKHEAKDRRQRGETKGKPLGPRNYRIIVSVEPVEPADTACIEVDSPSHLFLAGKDMIPTHNSMIRPVYREWMVKDKMIRVNAIHHDRNGAGVPIAYAGPNTTPAEMGILSALAQSYRAGQASGGALPFGADLKLKGVEGSVPDTTGYIRYLDEKIAIAFQGQFMSLGSTQSGSRSLGETFYDSFTLLQETIANEYMATTNEHVIEDLIDLNFGESEQAPLLTWQRDESTSATVADLVSLVGTGLITVSPEMEEWIRAKYKLPEAPDIDLDDPDIDPELPPAAKVLEIAASRAAAKGRINQPQRVLAAEGTAPDFGNREPTEVEQQAGVDFEKIYDTFEVALAALVARWMLVVKPAVTSDLAERIENIFAEAFIRTGSNATDATLELDLASLGAEPIGADVIEAALVTYAATAMAQAIDEARYQGVDLGPPDTAHLEIVLGGVSAALAVVMAKSASEAASRAALARVGSGLSAATIALEVSGALNDLTDTYPRDVLAGALSRAQFNARRAVFEQANADKLISSEISDSAECGPCKDIDGTEYASWDEAAQDYPQGYFRMCRGRSRCRGLVICVLETNGNS